VLHMNVRHWPAKENYDQFHEMSTLPSLPCDWDTTGRQWIFQRSSSSSL